MALARAKKKTTAAVVALSGAALATCGAYAHAASSSASAASTPPAAATRSATNPAPTASSAVPSTTRPGTPAPSSSGSSTPSPSGPGNTASHGPSTASQGSGSTLERGVPAASGGGPLGIDSIQHTTEAGGRSVALTFDDGPDPSWTPQVLALLAQHHAKATFCEIGPNAARYPYLAKEITAAGHRLCDHSVHHNEQQSRKPLAYNTNEIVQAQQDIANAAGPGAKLWYYRAPGGDFSPAIRNIAGQRGLRPLGWTIDSEDWKRPGAATILQNINKELKPGGVILMHDAGGNRSQTVQALAKLLDQLDTQGYTYNFPAR
ncbi:polysaccharide deacetylase family protein [Streptomyces sp. NPDC055299]